MSLTNQLFVRCQTGRSKYSFNVMARRLTSNRPVILLLFLQNRSSRLTLDSMRWPAMGAAVAAAATAVVAEVAVEEAVEVDFKFRPEYLFVEESNGWSM